jgi:hypothetical protein
MNLSVGSLVFMGEGIEIVGLWPANAELSHAGAQGAGVESKNV